MELGRIRKLGFEAWIASTSGSVIPDGGHRGMEPHDRLWTPQKGKAEVYVLYQRERWCVKESRIAIGPRWTTRFW